MKQSIDTITMHRLLLTATFLFVVNNAFCQRHCFVFDMEGTVNKNEGNIELIPVANNNYYPHDYNLSSKIAGGKFSIKDSIIYPTAFFLGIRKKPDANWDYLSDVFFVEPCSQNITSNAMALKECPAIANKTMEEWNEEFTVHMRETTVAIDRIFDERDSLTKVYRHKIPENLLAVLTARLEAAAGRRNHALLDYAKVHHNSYIVLWKLVQYLPGGYKPIYDSVFNQLSPHVKNTFTGIQLRKNLQATRSVAIGSKFPQFQLLDTALLQVKGPELSHEKKYTLVNFWEASWFPSIRQFPAFKELYKNYKKAGFEMVGISVDNQENISLWKGAIKEHQLPWKQYLDKDGKVAAKLCIDFCPANYLLDENGRIIKKNISPVELEQILKTLLSNTD